MSKETVKKGKQESKPKRKYGLKIRSSESVAQSDQPKVEPSVEETASDKQWLLEVRLADGTTTRGSYPSRKTAVEALVASNAPWVLLRVAPEKPRTD